MSPCPAYRDLKNLAETVHLSLPTWKVAGTPINYRTMYLEICSLPEMDLKAAPSSLYTLLTVPFTWVALPTFLLPHKSYPSSTVLPSQIYPV